MIYLFDALNLPVQGQRSSVEQASLRPGQFRRLANFDLARNFLTSRWGCDRFSAAAQIGGAGAAFRGAAVLGGFLFVAVRVGGETRIYQVQANGVTTERTAGAGVLGNTRFSTDGFVEFAAVREENPVLGNADLYIASNGLDFPRIANQSSLFTFGIAATISVPSAKSFFSQPSWTHWILVKDSGATAAFTNAVQFLGADSGATADENHYDITLNAAAAVGDQMTINWTGTFAERQSDGANVFSLGPSVNAKQLHLVIEEAVANASDPTLGYLQLEVNAGSVPSYQSIYDPTAGQFYAEPVFVEIGRDATNVRYVASFEVPTFANTDFTTVTNMRFTVKKRVAANRTFKIVAIMAGGTVAGEAQHIIAYKRAETRVDSRAIPCQSQRSPSLAEVGASRQRLETVPSDRLLYFQYLVTYPDNTGSGDESYAMFYRKDAVTEDQRFYLVGTFQGTTAVTGFSVKTDNLSPVDKYFDVEAPSFRNIMLPKAKSLLSANNRLYACDIDARDSEVWVSDHGYPLRFGQLRLADDGSIDELGPVILRYGGQFTQKVVALPGAILGTDTGFAPVFVFTDKEIQRIAGRAASDIANSTLASPHGTTSPGSISTYRSAIFYVDAEDIPRRMDYGQDAQRLGQYEIEDEFEGGDLTNCSSIVYKDQWRVYLQPSGGTGNQRGILYDDLGQRFHRHEYNLGWAGVVRFDGKLFGFTSDCFMFELEKSGQLTDEDTSGVAVPISQTIHTGALRDASFKKIHFGPVGIVCDEVTGGTATVTRVDLIDSTNAGRTVGVIDLESGVADKAFREDIHVAEGGPPGIDTYMARIEIVMNLTPGKYVQAITLETDGRDLGPDVEPNP